MSYESQTKKRVPTAIRFAPPESDDEDFPILTATRLAGLNSYQPESETFVPSRIYPGNPFEKRKTGCFWEDCKIGSEYAKCLGYPCFIQVFLSGKNGNGYGMDIELFLTRNRDHVVFRKDNRGEADDVFIIASFNNIEEREWAINHILNYCQGCGDFDGVCGHFQEPS